MEGPSLRQELPRGRKTGYSRDVMKGLHCMQELQKVRAKVVMEFLHPEPRVMLHCSPP